jgi:rhodanese-related sulfurtransferase
VPTCELRSWLREPTSTRFPQVDPIAPEQARALVADGAQFVDVRTDHEWEAGRIEGATHIELAELAARAAEIDRERPVVFYCRGDNRSDMAAAAFEGDGYRASVLAGGIQAWVDAGLPIEPQGGYVADSGEAASILEARKRALP